MTKRRYETLPSLVRLAKGLAHPARMRVVSMLAGGELCVCQVVAALGLAPSTVSKHLSVLEHGGLVLQRRDGKLVFYRLADDGLAAALLPQLLGFLRNDPAVRADRALVSRLRRVPVEVLCAADLDLAVVGVHRSAAAPRRRPPS